MSMLNCIECKGSIEYCFCSCPYCGNIMENCCCNLNSKRDNDKSLPIKLYSKHGLSKQPKTSILMSTKDDDWWRLEKWQIGRSKFP